MELKKNEGGSFSIEGITAEELPVLYHACKTFRRQSEEAISYVAAKDPKAGLIVEGLRFVIDTTGKFIETFER